MHRDEHDDWLDADAWFWLALRCSHQSRQRCWSPRTWKILLCHCFWRPFWCDILLHPACWEWLDYGYWFILWENYWTTASPPRSISMKEREKWATIKEYLFFSTHECKEVSTEICKGAEQLILPCSSMQSSCAVLTRCKGLRISTGSLPMSCKCPKISTGSTFSTTSTQTKVQYRPGGCNIFLLPHHARTWSEEHGRKWATAISFANLIGDICTDTLFPY